MILLYHRWCTSFNRERNILNISQSTNWQSRVIPKLWRKRVMRMSSNTLNTPLLIHAIFNPLPSQYKVSLPNRGYWTVRSNPKTQIVSPRILCPRPSARQSPGLPKTDGFRQTSFQQPLILRLTYCRNQRRRIAAILLHINKQNGTITDLWHSN